MSERPKTSGDLNEVDADVYELNGWRDAEASDALGLDGMFESLEADLEQERGPRAWLRSRPSWQRWLAASLVVPGTAALVLLMKPRSDMDAYPMTRLAGLIILSGVALTLTIAAALRPLHRPTLKSWQVWSIALLGGVGAPLLFAALPTRDLTLSWGGGMGLSCMMAGLMSAAPLIVALLLLIRTSQRLSHRLLLAAASVGLAGNFVLEFSCSVSAPMHLITSHTMLSVVLLLAAALTGVLVDNQRPTRS